MYCNRDNQYISSFISNVKRSNLEYCVVYNKSYENDDFVITYNELVFDDFDDFLNQVSSNRL